MDLIHNTVIDLNFFSIDDFLQGLTKLDIYATQLSPGRFACRHREIQLPKVVIGDRHFSHAFQFHTSMSQDYLYIVLPQAGECFMSVNGTNLPAHQPLVFSQHQEMLFKIPHNFPRYYVIIISSEELAQFYGEAALRTLKAALNRQSFSENIFVDSESAMSQLSAIINNLLNTGHLLSYQAVLNAQDALIHLLCNLLTLTTSSSKLKHINQSRKLAIVRRALHHIHHSSTLDITIPTLAQASFCCVRSLEYSFKTITGMTPKQYIIKRRLQLIHCALQKDQKSSINELAKAYGIVNRGRFAQDYFKFFDEYPHQTQHR